MVSKHVHKQFTWSTLHSDNVRFIMPGQKIYFLFGSVFGSRGGLEGNFYGRIWTNCAINVTMARCLTSEYMTIIVLALAKL